MDLSGLERIGIFGGTFDPPHIGHLVAALEVRHTLALNTMLLVVANEPWQKADRPMSSAADRMAMVQAAVADVDGLEASRIEIDRGGPSYTADTLDELRRQSSGAALFVVLGADAAAGVRSWERANLLQQLASFVVVTRPGTDSPLPDDFHWTKVEVPRLEVSSTDLRQRVRDDRPIDFLVPPGVATCITERRLYRVRG